MTSISLFCEDLGHQRILNALVGRVAEAVGATVTVDVRNSTGGKGRALQALATYVRDIRDGVTRRPDLLVVAIDANCKGYATRRAEAACHLTGLGTPCVCAIPDPHVERWLLLDGQAFKTAVGSGCGAPDQKCDKDRYKGLLRDAVRAAGVEPLLGGLEHAERIIAALDLERAAGADRSLDHFVRDLQAALRVLGASG